MQRYEVLLETGFKGDSVQLQLNDSVMFAARVTEDAVTVELSVPKQEKQSDFFDGAVAGKGYGIRLQPINRGTGSCIAQHR